MTVTFTTDPRLASLAKDMPLHPNGRGHLGDDDSDYTHFLATRKQKIGTFRKFFLDPDKTICVNVPMTLQKYLQKHRLSQSEFARRVGVKQPTVYRWILGRGVPNVNTMRRVIEVTHGRVKPNDFWGV